MRALISQPEKSNAPRGKKTRDSRQEELREIGINPKRGFPFGRHLSFSIDDGSVQMATVSHVGRKKRIRDVRKVYIPNALIGTPGRDDFVANAIDDFVNEFCCRGAQVSIAVSGKETALRTFLTPILKKRELVSAIQFEARKQIPFPLEDCIYDFRPTYKVVGAGQARFKIALQAATRRLIKQHLEPFRQRKIAISHVYHSQDVIGQLLRYLPGFNEDNNYTLMNIERNHSEISFYRGASLEFFHISAVGSSALRKQDDKSNFESFAQMLAVEIQTSLDYYAGQYPRSTPNRIFVYGDLAYSTELLQLLNGHTGFGFERFPVEELDFIPKGECPYTEALPVCLPALASSVCDVRLANLLPAEDKVKQAKRKAHTLAQVFLILLTLLLAAGWAIVKAKTIIAENNLISLNKQVDSFKSSDAYHTYNVLKRQIAGDRTYIEKVKESPSYLSLNLKELSLVTPRSIRLFHLAYQADESDKNLTLQGIVTSGEMPPEIILAEYVENLNFSPLFENVSLTKHVKRRRGDVFEIEFEIGMRGIV